MKNLKNCKFSEEFKTKTPKQRDDCFLARVEDAEMNPEFVVAALLANSATEKKSSVDWALLVQTAKNVGFADETVGDDRLVQTFIRELTRITNNKPFRNTKTRWSALIGNIGESGQPAAGEYAFYAWSDRIEKHKNNARDKIGKELSKLPVRARQHIYHDLLTNLPKACDIHDVGSLTVEELIGKLKGDQVLVLVSEE